MKYELLRVIYPLIKITGPIKLWFPTLLIELDIITLRDLGQKINFSTLPLVLLVSFSVTVCAKVNNFTPFCLRLRI